MSTTDYITVLFGGNEGDYTVSLHDGNNRDLIYEIPLNTQFRILKTDLILGSRNNCLIRVNILPGKDISSVYVANGRRSPSVAKYLNTYYHMQIDYSQFSANYWGDGEVTAYNVLPYSPTYPNPIPVDPVAGGDPECKFIVNGTTSQIELKVNGVVKALATEYTGVDPTVIEVTAKSGFKINSITSDPWPSIDAPVYDGVLATINVVSEIKRDTMLYKIVGGTAENTISYHQDGNKYQDMEFGVEYDRWFLKPDSKLVVTGPVESIVADNPQWAWYPFGLNHAVNLTADMLSETPTLVTSTIGTPVPAVEYKFQFDGNPAHIVVTHSGGTPVSLNQVQSVSEVTTFNIAPANSRVVVLKPSEDWGYYDTDTHKNVRAPWTDDGSGGWNATMLAGWYTTPDKINTIEVLSEATTPDVISPFNRIYDLNDDMLTELSDIMPSVYAGDPGTSPTPYDDNQFILNLLALPFKLPEAARADLVQIVIGNNDTGVMATQVVQDRVEIDLGVIQVAGLVDSSYDYSACKFQLIAPFVGKEMDLSPSDVIGKQVSVKYELDIYGGEITINVFNGDPEPFMSETDRVGTDIPIRVLNEVVGSQGRYQTTNNGILKAFIRVTRKELVDSEFANLTTTVGVLGSQSGYVELVNADLDGIRDSSTVVDILKGGVVIR